MQISCPGKLIIAGEWAVLEPGNPAIVTTVDRRVSVKITARDDQFISINAPDLGFKVKAKFEDDKLIYQSSLTEIEKEKLVFLKNAIEICKSYLSELNGFQIETDSSETYIELGDQNKTKLGFGSSAGITVACIAGILKLHNKDFDNQTLYKLASLTHYLAQGKLGSGFDVAAAIYGGTFVYSSFDQLWLEENYQKQDLATLIKRTWPGFYYQDLTPLPEMHILVGFSGKSASTSKLLEEMNKFKEQFPYKLKETYQMIATVVKELVTAWEQNDQSRIQTLIKENRKLLTKLSSQSGIELETEKLKTIADIAEENGAAGKLSGAGGGDCGIAITFNKENAEQIKQVWQEKGITPLNIELQSRGINLQ